MATLTAFFNIQDHITRRVEQMRRSLGSLSDVTRRVNRDFDEAFNQRFNTNIFDMAKSAGIAMGVAGTAMTAGLGLMVKTAADFDSQMSKVQALAGATRTEFIALREKALELGSSTSFSASQAAEGMQMLAAAGMVANDIMGAMPGVLSAAAASGTDMALVAETMGTALNIFGLEATKSVHVADVLAEVANRSNADIIDMAYTMKYAGPIATQLGYSIEDLGAAVIEMADAGIKGEQAGTILRSSLLNLLNPSDGAAKEMGRLKLAVTDNKGEMLHLGDIIGQLENNMKNMTEAQKAQSLATIFGTEAVSGMMVLISRGKDKLNEYIEALERSDGAAEATAKIMQDNLKGALDQLGGAAESAAINIGSSLTPEVRMVAEGATKAVEAFNELSSSTKKVIAISAAVTAGLLLIGGPLLLLIGLLPSISAGFAMLSLPMLSLIGTGVAVIAGIMAIGFAIKSLWLTNDNFKKKVLEIWGQIKSSGMVIFNTLKEFWAVWGDTIIAYFSTIWENVKTVISGAVEIIGNVIAFGLNIITMNWEGAWGNIIEIIKAAWGIITGIFDNITSFFSREKTIDVKVNRKVRETFVDNIGAEVSKFAKGTNFAPGGISLVGEEGPELVNLPRGSQVLPADETRSILASQTVNQKLNQANIPLLPDMTQTIDQRLNPAFIPSVSDATQHITQRIIQDDAAVNNQLTLSKKEARSIVASTHKPREASGKREISVNITGENHFHNEADEDRLVAKTVNAIKRLLDEESTVSGNGVYDF